MIDCSGFLLKDCIVISREVPTVDRWDEPQYIQQNPQHRQTALIRPHTQPILSAVSYDPG